MSANSLILSVYSIISSWSMSIDVIWSKSSFFLSACTECFAINCKATHKGAASNKVL